MNVHQERGIAFFKNGDYHRAIEHFDRAIGYAESVNLLVIRSSCRLNLNDLKPALADAKAAIQLNREDSRGYIMAGDILIEMDRSSVALEVCASGLKRVPHIGAGFEVSLNSSTMTSFFTPSTQVANMLLGSQNETRRTAAKAVAVEICGSPLKIS